MIALLSEMTKRSYKTMVREAAAQQRLLRHDVGSDPALFLSRCSSIFAFSGVIAYSSMFSGEPIQIGIVPIVIDEVQSFAMVDTGSSFSYVSESFAKGSHTARALTIHLADGSKTSVRKAKDVTVRLGTSEMDHHMYVMPSLPIPCILGFDFLADFGITISPKDRTIRLATGEVVPFESKRRTKLFSSAVASALSNAQPPATAPAAKTSKQEEEFPRPKLGDADLTEEQRIRAQQLLDDLESAFTSKERPIGNSNTVLHRVRPQCPPFKAKLAALSPQQIAVEKECIEQMIKYGVAVESQSEWASRPSFAPKPDGSIRFCLNFRQLNKYDTKDSYPLPRCTDLLNMLAKCRYFTKLDAAHGYWQIQVHPDDRKYTAVITHFGLYEFVRMPFGLSNAPATYQRLMDKVLGFGLNKFCCVYLDDVLVFSETFEQHLNHVYRCICALRDAGLLLKAKKCSFFMRLCEYLGHLVGNGEIRMTMEKVRRILEFPIPTNVQAVQSFLGVTGYYRKFIPNFGPRVAILHDLTKKGIKFEWTVECQTILEQIQAEFNNNVVLKLPDYSKRFIIDTDASDIGVGAVLSQLDDLGRERPVLFASRKLSPAELKWPVRDKEALAIVYALNSFRAYIWGSGIPFLVRTDHHSLQWMQDAKTGRIARWATLLAEFEPFEIKYRKGSSNKVADALSRIFAWSECLPDVAFCGALLNDPVVVRNGNPFDLVCMPSVEDLYEAQRADDEFCLPRLSNLVRYPSFKVQEVPVPDSRKNVSLLGIETKGVFRPVLPSHLVERFIKSVHSNPLVAHMGAKRTAARCAELFVIPKLRKIARSICGSCIPCLRRKRSLPKVGKLASVAPTRPWEMISMDFSGPYPVSRRGNSYVLVIIDQFSKFVNLVACPQANAAAVLRALYERIICIHGPPEKLLSDNGSHFVNATIASMCHSFRIFKVQSSPYYPQGDGQVERFMSNLNNSLSCLCQDNVSEWCEFLPGVQSAYNATPHSSTFVAPYEVMFGRKPQPLVRSAHIVETPLVTETALRYANRLRKTIEEIQQVVRRNVQHAWMQRAIQYNANRSKVSLAIGQHVMIRLSPLQLSAQTTGKLRIRWSEPMLITAVRSSGKAFEVCDSAGKKYVVNVTRLLPMPPKSWTPQKVVKSVSWDNAVFDPVFVPDEQVYAIYGSMVQARPKARPRPRARPAEMDEMSAPHSRASSHGHHDSRHESRRDSEHSSSDSSSLHASSLSHLSQRSIPRSSSSDYDIRNYNHDDDYMGGDEGGDIGDGMASHGSDESIVIVRSDRSSEGTVDGQPASGSRQGQQEADDLSSSSSSSSSFHDDPLDMSILSENCPSESDESFGT